MTKPKIHLRYNIKIINKINNLSNLLSRNPKAQKSKKIVVDISYMCIIFLYICKVQLFHLYCKMYLLITK
jgi:hypothetical protein